jgi:hypothetical protein
MDAVTNSAGGRVEMSPHSRPRGRAAIAVLAVATLSLLAAPVQAVEYDFLSVYSGGAALSELGATVPSVNTAGTLAFAALTYDPIANASAYVVFTGDGVQLQPLLDLTDILGVGTPSSLVINDTGAVAVHYTLDTGSAVLRIAADGSYVVLARADRLGAAPYLELAPAISMNAAGQVAVLATNLDGTFSIVRLDDGGGVEIAHSSAGLVDFSSPAINDAGVVAFTAQAPEPGGAHLYSGSGGALTEEGTTDPCPGPSSRAPVINTDGLVLSDCGDLPLFSARGGIVSVLLSGGEDPIFGRLASGYSLNDRGQVVFVTGPAGSAEAGVFTGNDPLGSKVVRSGDAVFGLTVDDVRIGQRSINDAGQIALLVQVGGGTPTSHVVLATPRRTPQSIAFPELAGATFGAPPLVVTATASSGLAVTFAAAGVCSVADGRVSLLGAGACTITASQAGDSTYLPATDVAQMFTILRATQAIAFGPLPSPTFGDAPFTVTATASSGLPVTIAAGGACSITGDLVTLAGAGVCTVIASQAGNADYEPASDLLRAFTVVRASQRITFAPPGDRTFGDPAFPLNASATSGLPVSFSAGGPCTVAGGAAMPVGGGSCVITASQGGNADYEPAADVARTFVIAAAGQTITFAPLPDRTFGDAPFSPAATASSGLPVSFGVLGGACALAGAGVTITAAGACTVTASQGGDANYLPAPSVSRAFVIARAGQTIAFAPLPSRRLGDPPFEVTATASSTLPVAFTATGACSVSDATVTVTAAGLCTITASQAGDADFDAAASIARAFPVSGVLVDAHFDLGTDGFDYVDNAFRGAGQAAYASGSWSGAGGYRGGALRVSLGGIDNNAISGMSGGWRTTFTLPVPTKVVLYVRGNLTQSPSYEADEKSELLVSVDGVLRGASSGDYLAQLVGDGNSGGAISTGWRLYSVSLGTLSAGPHTLVLGGYNSKKTEVSETTTVLIDDVLVTEASAGARAAVATLDVERFKENIRILADFGDRTQGSPSYMAADHWLEGQLTAAGYKVERHRFTYNGQPRDSIYVTKVGTLFPDQMYIVSAHLDGRGGGGAANDNASGCSLVLESARALAGLPTAISVRFIFWNNEETGLNGSTAYVSQRRSLQGVENPPGSGVYPEPRWLGMIQHDQILFDHGLPPQPGQIPNADLDVEYQASSSFAGASLQLASALRTGNGTYSTDYPAQVGSNMNYTDSVPFQNYTATVSVRDNQRVAEIGNGSNPHWHQPSDLYSAFSEVDFRLGFNAVQMTLGTVAELAGAMTPPAQP